MLRTLQFWEEKFTAYFEGRVSTDGSHDVSHSTRVAHMALDIASQEKLPVDRFVLMAAAYFHDCISLPKDHPNAKHSSVLAAREARRILLEMQFPEEKLAAVCHAIEAHSFSAGIAPETLEAKIVQDADRMEALGAIGTIRVFYVSGLLGKELYHPEDLTGENRELDDKRYAIDHFYCKLFKLPDFFQTTSARFVAEKRVAFLHRFIDQVCLDLKKGEGPALTIMEVCQAAGRLRLQLLDAKDPFAEFRGLQRETFALDNLLGLRSDFPLFFDQLHTEIFQDIPVLT